ncbi:MAG TPA: AMP-binding protein [Gemmatimonadota bacterium]|nr:AMP-binding protein [Gemmatimonadota bacterium]
MDPRGRSDLSARAAAAEAGDRLALVADGRGWTWAELAAEVAREGERLAAAGTVGNGPISRVAFDAHPTTGSVIRLLALVEAGVCAVPLDPRLPAAVRAERIRMLAPLFDLDQKIAIAGPGGLEWSVRSRSDPADATPLAVLFTSGTTGAPRAVELSRSAFRASAAASAAHLGWEPDDRWLCCLPLAHVGGLSIVIRCLAARRTVVLAGDFDPPAIFGLLERDAVTLASFVPTMLHRLFEADPGWRAPPSLRAALLGGGPAGDELWDEVARRGVPARATYGMTETCAQVATARADAPRRLIPLDGVRLRVAGDQIEVAGPMLCTRVGGPAPDDEPWTADGFLRTRDFGRLADGSLEVTGRADGTIITGGQNVVPSAVEAVLATHPAVRRAAVFGVPDEEWGELVGAALEESGAAPRPTTDELRAWLASRLAPYERPRRIAWARKLPESLSGKLDRTAVRERWRGAMEVV